MKEIDFSCKHNILIKNEDGTRIPMDQPYFISEKVAPGTWKLLTDGDFFYLVEGENEALAIDSGYGCGNVREFLQTLTEKPVRNIANTHDHFDHTANNAYFECAFMAEETKALATKPFPSFEGIDFPRDYKIQVIDEGFVFQLGNRELETFKIPDHAAGSLVFLDLKERLLFGGDELGMPGGKRLNYSVERFMNNMKKLYARRHQFDWICAGFGLVKADIIEQYLENASYILAGNQGEPYPKPDFPSIFEKEGQIIYKRHLPRPCDLPKSIDLEKQSHIRVMEHAGCRIFYDDRQVYDR